MQMSDKGRGLLKQREGECLKAYKDSVGVWTIAVGHTSAAGPPKVYPGLTITATQSDEILTRDLKKYEAIVNKAIKVPLTQNEFDALVSLCFNIPAALSVKSSVVRKLNAGDKKGAAEAILLYRNAGGKPILLKRRQAERLQFLKGY
jgi:lysozyme